VIAMASVVEIDFQLLMENSADIICRSSRELVMSYVSPSSVRVLGWTPAEMLEIGLIALVYPEDMPVLVAARDRTHAEGGTNTQVTARLRKKDGSLAWMEMNPRLLHDSLTGNPRLEVVVTMRDVTARKLLEERLAALAMTDGLTGLANRRSFDEELEREWRRTLREGSQMSLLLLDIDHFKGLNDRHGHQVGDDCLRAVAAATLGAVRATDVVARYGGEEIAVILPSVGMEGAAAMAEKVRLAVEGLRLSNEDNLEGGGWLTASVGAATALARHGGTMKMPASLLLTADNALYKAKSAGRNRVETGMLIVPQVQEVA
jgi:diguanylate cyclase (GGDEF)-like protein/PAS domain S-box-containing protein